MKNTYRPITTIAQRLQAERKRLNLTQSQAATLIGVSPRLLWQWEQGLTTRNVPTPLEALEKLAREKQLRPSKIKLL